MEADLSDAMDSVWILTTTFIIFLMQSGFALLESGSCSKKNQVNIMMKNVMDVVIGGFVYWCIGYGLQYGDGSLSNPFCGFGKFFLNTSDYKTFLHFIFQFSFSSTTITIVSGAVAERCNFNAHCVFCVFLCLIYCIPSGWLWRSNGFLNKLGAIDYCGAAGVHLIGGVASLVSAIRLKPRIDRYGNGWKTPAPKPENAVNVISGAMLLWWGFFVFNSGSTFGVSNGLWKIAARVFAVTLVASTSGGLTSLIYSRICLRYTDISVIINGILTASVSVCGCAALIETYDAFYIGIVGALIACFSTKLVNRFQIDDPVGAIAVHAGGGAWGVIVTGLSVDYDEKLKVSVDYSKGQRGLFKSGGFKLLGKQLLALLVICVWTAVTVWIVLYFLDFIVKVRMSREEEVVGGDMWCHGIGSFNVGHKIEKYNCNKSKIEKRMCTIGEMEEIPKERAVTNSEVNAAFTAMHEITLNPANLDVNEN